MKTLIFENISKTFQDGSQTITALKPTNFSIEEGELLPSLDHLVLGSQHF